MWRKCGICPPFLLDNSAVFREIRPQFADQGALPLHGFARTSVWTVASTSTGLTVDGPRTSITLTLADSAATEAVWPGNKFGLSYTITLGPRCIGFELTAANTGDAPWAFTGCLQ